MLEEISQLFDNLSLPSDSSSRSQSLVLKFAGNRDGFGIYDFARGNTKVSVGDDADYLKIFMTMAAQLTYLRQLSTEPLLVAADLDGHRLFTRIFTASEREKFRYAYVAFGAAVKQLPDSEMNETISFFAEISLEDASKENFEKEAIKVARSLSGQTREAWDRIIDQKLDFLKTDLYAFHVLKLYSWGFRIIEPDNQLSTENHMVRPKPRKPRGASRK